MRVRIKLYRDSQFLIREFDVEPGPNHTILDVLFYLKENQDPTLSFRSMCRSGICGTCSVKVNGNAVLACKTKVGSFTEPILIEPIDNLPVIKDLVVEHKSLSERLRRLKVWYEPLNYNLQAYRTNPLVDKSFKCIACGLCDSSCPVFLTNPEFAGPMALSRAYKISQDPRNSKREEVLVRIRDGKIELCTHCKNCSMVCPTAVMPETIIKFEESELLKKGLLSPPAQNSFDFF